MITNEVNSSAHCRYNDPDAPSLQRKRQLSGLKVITTPVGVLGRHLFGVLTTVHADRGARLFQPKWYMPPACRSAAGSTMYTCILHGSSESHVPPTYEPPFEMSGLVTLPQETRNEKSDGAVTLSPSNEKREICTRMSIKR